MAFYILYSLYIDLVYNIMMFLHLKQNVFNFIIEMCDL